LLIQDVVAFSDCCSKVVEFPREIRSGEDEKIRVRVTPDRLGLVAGFSVRTNDPGTPEVRLFARTVPKEKSPAYLQRPGDTAFDWTVRRVGDTRLFTIQTIEPANESLWIENAESAHDCVEIEPVASPKVVSRGSLNVIRHYQYSLRAVKMPPVEPDSVPLRIRRSDGTNDLVQLQISGSRPIKLSPTGVWLNLDAPTALVDVVATDDGPWHVEMATELPKWLTLSQVPAPSFATNRFEFRMDDAAMINEPLRMTARFVARGPETVELELKILVSKGSPPGPRTSP
jgi:hypothetical protein